MKKARVDRLHVGKTGIASPVGSVGAIIVTLHRIF